MTVLNLPSMSDRGVLVERGFSGEPAEGVLITWTLEIGEPEQVLYFSRDGMENFPHGTNRTLPWVIQDAPRAFFARTGNEQPDKAVQEPAREGLFALARYADGRVLAILPTPGPRTLSWLHVTDDGQYQVRLGTLGTAVVAGDLPAMAWAWADDVHTACRSAWAVALACEEIAAATVAREAKTYPELFEYLGWCSWEEYHQNISEAVLVPAIRALADSDLPIRWVLVDDGFLDHEGRRLRSFAPDDGSEKFPNGWDPIVSLRADAGIRWMGLWHNMIGYWRGFDPEHPLVAAGQVKQYGERYLPLAEPEAVDEVYRAFMRTIADAGFDFVKIDNQTDTLTSYAGSDNAAEAAGLAHRALEKHAHASFDALINCMCHDPIGVFGTRYSAVSRCSLDYKVGDLAKACSHILQSYQNTLWLGQTVWPDHDMFHSCDDICGRMMAVTKAMSGGPVYLSDSPGKIVAEYITPLCLADGKLLRPLAPAGPLPDSVFVDALNEPEPYRVIAPLPNHCAAVAVYNLMQSDCPTLVLAEVTPDDYTHATGMMQPYPGRWELPAEGLVAYDWHGHRGGRLGTPMQFELEGLADRLVLLCPITDGWAVIGRPDKYLSPAAVEVLSTSPDQLELRMIESGPFVIYSPTEPTAPGSTFEPMGGELWVAEMPIEKQGQVLGIAR